MTGEQIASLEAELAKFLEGYRAYFRRKNTFGYLHKYLLGLLADMKRKSIEPIGLGRWHVEKWSERAKQEGGFGDFEVRTYVSVIRHWLCSRLAMVANALTWKL